MRLQHCFAARMCPSRNKDLSIGSRRPQPSVLPLMHAKRRCLKCAKENGYDLDLNWAENVSSLSFGKRK